ncbi:extensin family protein [Celeribacter arenosi]|uniref:Extensin family protein n=1 Tax=Celeribacter arenosi TaxID=792649 RepID=A0ABP7K4F9_9RHOB
MIRFSGILLAGLVLAAPALANLDRSPLPSLRPFEAVGVVAAPVAPVAKATSSQNRLVSPVPRKRPAGLSERAKKAARKAASYAKNGSVCGVADIRGRALSAIASRVKGCGISNPVEVTEIAGVKLRGGATIDCTTAKALRNWIEKGAKPAVGRFGGGVADLRVVASYACRTRNNQAGAKISEHGRGRAVDITAIGLANGRNLTVLNDWDAAKEGKILRKMHRAACGPFGTVLGPEANKYHRDHFHFDTARYRSGSYCR